jgi:pimeloyl-ACP methyl ester carboxylesterase
MSEDVTVRTTPPKSIRSWAALAVVPAVLLAVGPGCSTEADQATATTQAPVTSNIAGDRYEPRLVGSDCPDPGLPTERISCQTLVLPENRAEPQGRQVELPVVRIEAAPNAVSGTPTATGDDAVRGDTAPVIVLHGGPGGGVVEDWAVWSSLLDDLGTEVVLYDQRGGGRSVPRLDCPEHAEALAEALGTDRDREAERRDVADALARCHDRLLAEGVDVGSYDTASSTSDLEDLRRALGVDRVTLVGSSYGSRLALDYLRTHPDRVRSLVLDGVDPPGRSSERTEGALAADAVQRLLDACAADSACDSAHPDLGDSLTAATRGLDSRPSSVTVEAETGPVTLTLTGDDMYAGLFVAMYDTEVIPLIPALIEAVASGDVSILQTFAARILPGLSATAVGAYMSVECADSGGSGRTEGTPPERSATLELVGSVSFCSQWPVEPAPEDFGDPVDPANPPPSLVITGSLDPVTPAEDAREVAGRLGSHLVELPRAGHAAMMADTCARSVLRSFLADPDRPELACTAAPAPTPFN